jgi:6 kDa early secretory antigenic target
MSEHMSFDFHGIEASATAIKGSVKTTHDLLEEGRASLAKLAEAWGGNASEAYQAVQQNWDNTSKELNESLQALAVAISGAGSAMQETETANTGMFT